MSVNLSFIFLSFGFGLILQSCVGNPARTNLSKPPEKVFFASYDSVWKAAHTVVKYPLANENQDTGIIETDSIKSSEGWQTPESTKTPSNGQKYKIIIRLVKGESQGKESVKVSIDKKIQLNRDFFSEPEDLVSDGLEEKMILYRMDRELIIDRAINKGLSKTN